MQMSSLPIPRTVGRWMLALAAVLVSACGGGGADPSPPVGGSGGPTATAYAAGPITGFGSIIVNGVRYDDSAAAVLDDDDGARSRDHLRLGMTVEIDAADVDRGLALGRALRIRFGSEIVGPVDAVDAAAGRLTVLGQTVVTDAGTVIDDDLPGGLASVRVGDVLEVYARFDRRTNVYTATRIEPKSLVRFYRLRGVISSLDTASTTFVIGGQVVNYAAVPAAERPNALANGMAVKVLLETVPSAGQWVAVRLRHGVRPPAHRSEADVHGTVTAWTSATDFEVNGLRVDASRASFPDGQAGVVLGAEVEVEGAIVEGVLVAREVELEDDDHDRDRLRIELHGAVSSLDTAARTFVLRGVVVSYAAVAEWKDGSEADLANGRQVEVKGHPSVDRTRIDAVRIEFE